MAIPFTQYLLPNGRRHETSVKRPDEIEALARDFIKRGGRYECEVLSTGEVSLTAVKAVDGEEQDVEIVVCPNGPSVGERVDELVRLSVQH